MVPTSYFTQYEINFHLLSIYGQGFNQRENTLYHSLIDEAMFDTSIEKGPLPNLVKSRSREIGYYNDRIALQFDRHFGSTTVDLPVKC